VATAASSSDLPARTPPAATTTTAAVARRAGPSLVAGGVFAYVILRMAFDAGGYFPPSYLSAGMIAFATVGVLLIATRPLYALSTQALTAVIALGGLALWAGLSSLWSPAPSAAIDAMQRDLAYVALLALGLIAAGSGRYARRLVWLALGVICVICGAALLARLYPDVVSGDETSPGFYRLSYPLTYWNELGALCAVGTALAFGLAADPSVRWALRGLAGAVTVPLLITLTMTLSRGAWIALIAGLVVLVLLGAHRGSLLLTGAIVGGGCALALLRLQSYPALIDDPTAGSGRESAGHAFGPQLLLLSLAVGVALGAFGAARASEELMTRLDRAFRPVIIGVGVLAAVLLIGGAAFHSSSADALVVKQLHDVGDWVDKQWDDFNAPAGLGPTAQGAKRITSGVSGTRSEVYRVALDDFGDAPFEGNGAGSFRVSWLSQRRIGEQLVNTHSLELETLAELGIVGGGLLAVFLGSIGYAAVRSRLKPGGLTRSQSAAVGAAFTVWAVHSAVDWDWQMGALTGVVLLLACTLFPYGRSRRVRTRPRTARAAA
jgi:hypothetical protein